MYNHLKEVAPALAEQFGSEHRFQGTELKLGEVVNFFNQSKSRSSTISKDSHENITRSLVYNHLKEVAPELANQFVIEHKFKKSQLNLRKIVKVFNKSKQADKFVNKNCVNLNVGPDNSSKKVPRRSFTTDEDDLIKAAIEEAGDEEVDCNDLAKKLGRHESSIHSRVELLKRRGGVKTGKQYFTLLEDHTIIETFIIPRLSSEKLSEIKLLNQQTANLNKELKKGDRSVMNRWNRILQPWLLQHYSGTLNLRVERMLANFLVETFTESSGIDWTKVMARQEFACHNKNSLMLIYSNMRHGASLKFNLEYSEVTLQQVVDYSEQVYGEGAQGKVIGVSANKLKRQMEVIAFFERKVEELGIVDFL